MKCDLKNTVQRSLQGLPPDGRSHFLSFAAGAMIYVVEEPIPEMSQGKHAAVVTVFWEAGFTVMRILDVTLG